VKLLSLNGNRCQMRHGDRVLSLETAAGVCYDLTLGFCGSSFCSSRPDGSRPDGSRPGDAPPGNPPSGDTSPGALQQCDGSVN
jgi:hypothetical protein